MLTFTGSTDVGRHFLRYAADSNLKRVYLELGGKSPNSIFPDAPDLDAAADSAAWAIFFNSGEMCTAGSRLVVHRDVAEQVVQRIVDTAAQWFPADPLLPETKMGPLVDQRRLERVLGASAARASLRAHELRTGGQQVLADTGGAYLEPTVVTGARAGQRAGPRRDLRPGADRADRRRRGRSRSGRRGHAVRPGGRGLDRDLGKAHRISRALRAGTVWVNCYEEGDMNVPFGGVKLSGFGRDKSRHALAEYTDLKTTWINYG